MKFAATIVWLAALAAAYAVGRSTPTGSESIAMLEQALAHRSPFERSLGMSQYLIGLNPSNLEATIERVEGQQDRFDQHDHELLMGAGMRFDSAAALDWALARPTGVQPQARIAEMLSLGCHNPAAARSLIETIDPDSRYTAAYQDAWQQYRSFYPALKEAFVA